MSRMAPKRCIQAVLICFLGSLAQVGHGQPKSKFEPARIKTVKKINKSFTRCKSDVLKKFKKKELEKAQLPGELAACKERFPGASLFTDCKKNALKGKKKVDRKALEDCRRFVRAAAFDPKDTFPYFVHKGQLYFAGVGMNQRLPLQSLAPPNFECGKVKPAMDDLKKAQYLLFGNHPRIFSALGKYRGKALLDVMGLKTITPDGVDIDDFGRVYGNPTDRSGVVFFPSASCNFEGILGSQFAGLSAYYLLDKASDSTTPYFGITYFKPETKVKTSAMIKEARELLGPGYQVFKKNEQTAFIAIQNVTETDDEKDPKNLCRKSAKKHQFVAIIQSAKEDPEKPQYVIVANVANLCAYGDLAAARIAK